MALKLSTGLRTALAGTVGLKSILNGGFLDIYSGGQPAHPDYAETGTFLVRITLGSSAGVGLTFGTAASGALPKSADVWSGVVSVAGVAGYFRLYGTGGTSGSSATERRIDGNVGVSGSGDLVISNSSIVLSATQTVDSFTLTVPGS